MSAAPFHFRTLDAPESVEARAEVVGWADDLYLDQLQTWEQHEAANRRNKQRAPTPEECRAKSRQIRVKRERNASYFDQTTAANPTR